MTVSGGDLLQVETVFQHVSVLENDEEVFQSVSCCDIAPYDDILLMSQLEAINYSLTALIFIILFVWVESRIRNSVWRFFGHGKSN